jgi:hypothetical protein
MKINIGRAMKKSFVVMTMIVDGRTLSAAGFAQRRMPTMETNIKLRAMGNPVDMIPRSISAMESDIIPMLIVHLPIDLKQTEHLR